MMMAGDSGWSALLVNCFVANWALAGFSFYLVCLSLCGGALYAEPMGLRQMGNTSQCFVFDTLTFNLQPILNTPYVVVVNSNRTIN